MQKPRIIFAFLWLSAAALFSPIWISLTFLFITGHGKGYGYDLRSEADIYVMFGVAFLLLWLLMVGPIFIWLTKYFHRLNKKYTLLPFVCFVLLFLVAASCMGWDAFLYVFTYHEPKRVTMYRPACLMLQSLFKIFAF